MAAITSSRNTAPLGAITTYRAVSGLSNILNKIKVWNEVRMTRKALAVLTDRQLDDIGLCRADIEMLGR